jgi:hypothetical protein
MIPPWLWNAVECIVTQNSVGEGGVSYTNAREKRFWDDIWVCILLRKLLEQRSGTFHHRNTPWSCIATALKFFCFIDDKRRMHAEISALDEGSTERKIFCTDQLVDWLF